MLWLALVLFVALTISVLRGGRLSNLADIHLRLWWLLVVAFGLQIAADRLPDRSWADETALGFILVSYVLLVVMVFANRDRPGMWLAGLGVLMNFTVIVLNGGMPVLAEAAKVASGFTIEPEITGSAKHLAVGPEVHLPFLADVIPIRFAGQGQVISLGDVFLAVGLASFLEAELRRPIRWFKRGARAQAGSAMRDRG